MTRKRTLRRDEFSEQDRIFMARALELAEGGRPTAHPNPYVGAVIVHGGTVLAEGFHSRFGASHAEAAAIASAREQGISLEGATLYVTLEPCCHSGKTPPCTKAIIESRIGEVIVAVRDPNPAVNGEGIARLEKAGLRVRSGLLEEEAVKLNEAYFHFRRTGLPFVTWKCCRTLDGRTTYRPGTRSRISSPEADARVDRLRASVDAVLVGSRTAAIDRPRLRVRSGAGTDPWRIVFDSRLVTPLDSPLVAENSDRRTLMIAAEGASSERIAEYRDAGVEVDVVPERNGHVDPRAALARIAERGIIEILCESGETLGRALMEEGLLRRVLLLQTPRLTERESGEIEAIEEVGPDLFISVGMSCRGN
ncbi:MAG: bifunctional diaminohydroxyphosphoribosylaminopyrimidine deaminase/5-amino-6-(5-phosphoribosylamino)uracil reductase RibD [Candidatus Hydrogenedentota bacterium]|nr:MAG: bifunctional diaminohydroxyphosphoribosylaminopyrimidine deaminase/5-amino-6-(5-phosphoribosylamino)uracil reductase RibD [Candidatus Hydrogenedentota bacterium]